MGKVEGGGCDGDRMRYIGGNLGVLYMMSRHGRENGIRREVN